MSGRYRGNNFDPSYRKPRGSHGGGGSGNGYGFGGGRGARPGPARDIGNGGYPSRNDPPSNHAEPQHGSWMNHYAQRSEYPSDPRHNGGPPQNREHEQPGVGIPSGSGNRTAVPSNGSGSGSRYGYVPDRPGGRYPPQTGDRTRGAHAGNAVQSGYNARSISPAKPPTNPSGYRNGYNQRPADILTGSRPSDNKMAENRNNGTYSQAVAAPAPSAPRYNREPHTQSMSAPADRTRYRLPEELRPRSVSGTSGDPRFTRNGQNVMVAPAPVTNGDARFKRNGQDIVVASVPNTPQRPVVNDAPLSAPPKSHTHADAVSPVGMIHPSRMGMVPVPPVNRVHPEHREQEERRRSEASHTSVAKNDNQLRSSAYGAHGALPRPNFVSYQEALDQSMHDGQPSISQGEQMPPPSSPMTEKDRKQDSTLKHEMASNDPSELSSLAKLRQFKASIAASRHKRPADVDFGRLAEMATTFLASEHAVPPTPTTQQASQMAQTPEVQTQVSASERPVAEVVTHPSLPRRPTDIGVTDNRAQATPSKSDATAPPASDVIRAKTREQELKERLLSLKKESQSPTTASAGGVPHRSDTKESQGPKTKDGNKRERPEEGEITEEETAKRQKPYKDVLPRSAGDAVTEPGSAGRRQRAEEWMKTTTQEAPSAPLSERQTRRGSRGGRGNKEKTRSPEIIRRASSGNRDRRYSTSSRPGAESGNSGGGFHDPSYRKNRQAEEENLRERGEVREHRPSLADRIHGHASDDRQRGKGGRRVSMNSQHRPQHPEQHDERRHSARPSRSPQRPAQRPDDDRSNYDRNQQANIAQSRDVLRGNSSHSRTGGSEHHGPARSSHGGYDDRRSYSNALGGHQGQPQPPPPAPTIPTNEVVETLALLKAQIQKLEAQLPGALVAPPPTPPPPPQRSVTGFNTPAAQPRSVSVTGDPRFTRRVDYDRPPSPQRPLPVPESRYDDRHGGPVPGPGYDSRPPYSDNNQQSAYPRSDERRGYDNNRSGYDQQQQQNQDPYMNRDRQHRDSVSAAYGSRAAPPPPPPSAPQSYSYDSRQTGPPANSGGYHGDYPTDQRGSGRYDLDPPPPPPPPPAARGRYDYDQPPHRNDPGPNRPSGPQSGGGRPRGRGGYDNAPSRDNGRSKNAGGNHGGRGGGGGDRGKSGRGGRGGTRGSGSGRRGRGRGRGN